MKKCVALALLALVAGCSSSKKKSSPGGADFALSVPAYAGAPTGIAEPVGISVSRTGAASSISITVTGLPAGITVDPLTIGATDTVGDLTFHVASGTPGDVPVQVVGTSAGKVHAADMDFVVRGAAGTLDTSFGTAGVSTNGILVAAVPDVRQAAVGSGGSFVVAGLDNNDLVLSRHHADGSLDASFGTGGVVTKANFAANSRPLSVAIAPDGKIVVAGTAIAAGDAVFARYSTDGLLDGGFGTNGVVTVDLASGSDDEPRGVAVDANGRVVAAGLCLGGGNATGLGAFVRLTAAGALDSTFATGGVRLSASNLGNVLLSPTGTLFAAGARSGPFVVEQVDATGAPVLTYGSAGTAISASNPFSAFGTLAQFPDGRIIESAVGNSPGYAPTFLTFTTAGAVDTAWGTSGVYSSVGEYFGMLPLADGSMFTAGTDGSNAWVLHVTAAGATDTSFGTSGRITLLPTHTAAAVSILPQSPYRALVVGGYQTATGFSEWSARIWR